MTAIQRFALHGTIMNPHSSGPYVRHEDHLAAMQGRCLAKIVEPDHTWPAGLLDRVKSALERIENNHCIRRIPADPTDPDLVLAEVRYLLEGKTPPFWVSKLPQRAAPAAVAPRARDLLGIVRTAQAEARRLINGEDSGSDLAQTKLDLPETLRVLEHALSQPAAVAGSALDVTLDEDQAGLLRDMLGDPAEYEEALTVRLIVCDGHSGHGLYVAQAEYQDEGAALLAPLPATAAPALEAPAAPVVPLKATPEMRAAFRSAFREGGFWDDRLDYALGQMLAAAPQAPAQEAPAAPAGWKLVPEVATQEMCAAMLSFLKDGFSLTAHGSRPMSALYADLLAAAPQAPAAPALSAAPIPVMPRAITAGLGLDDSGEEPAYCVMVAFRQEDDARYALSILSAGLGATAAPAAGNWIVAEEVDRLVRNLDVALHGEADAAPQASLCDIVGLAKAAAGKLGRPVLAATAAPAVDASDDKALLDFLRDTSCDLRSIDVPTGGDDSDVHWQVIEHYMSEPREREIGRSWSDDPREAIRAAIAAQAKEGGAAA